MNSPLMKTEAGNGKPQKENIQKTLNYFKTGL